MRIPLVSLAVLAVLTVPVLALDPLHAGTEYARLQKWRFSAPVSLPSPVTLVRDTATWTLSAGTVRLMEPLADGTITGLVFEGQGTFRMTIPDRYEVAQLQRYTRRPGLQTFEQTFTQMLLRSTDGALAKRFPSPADGVGEDALASRRHHALLAETFEDVDARVIAALLNPGDEQFIADMRTADFDWIRYDYDSSRAEEIGLVHLDARGFEFWVSLDRPEDRGRDGRPSAGRLRAALEHIDVKADLTNLSRTVGRNHQRLHEGRYVVEETFSGTADVTNALTLVLLPTATSLKAFAESGTALTVLRDPIGKRSAKIDNKLHDDDLFVILEKPLRRGERQRIRFEYELETANYAPGRSWYPSFQDGLGQKHTARLELTVHRKNEVRAMGKMESRAEKDGKETSVWIVDRPARMITFSTATRFEEVKVAPTEKIPPIISFGPDYQFSNTAKLRNVAADVANSMQYFQHLLGSNVNADSFFVTSIASGHGQAFDGFLHMSEHTFASEHPGASELFRAHEVAHTWWGHKVGWTTYRDQWMSEAFAEYCAMMFVRDVVKGGDGYFEEMLRSYEGIVKGNMAGGFSKFNRPWLIERSVTERGRVGPIAHGWRASTVEIPAGSMIQTYYKGPLVLHMLRMLISMRLGSDELFLKTLRDFLRENEGTSAGTEDFRRVLERNVGSDFGWFFDAWIYRAEIPSYTWRHSVRQDGNEFALTLDIERRDVGDDFVTVIPVRVEMEGGKAGILFIPNKESRQTVTYKVPARPRNVLFAPDSSLLAYVKRN